VTWPRRLRHPNNVLGREPSCEQAIVCVHTVPSLGAGVRRSAGSLRWLMLAAAAGRIPQIGPQQVTWDAGDAADGRHPLGRYDLPLRDRPLLDAQLTSDQSANPTTGGGAQQVHSSEDSGHLGRLSAAKSAVQPQLCVNAHYLFRETEPPVWHTIPMPIGQRIRAARAELGVTQRYVAKALGVNPSAVNHWESGLTKPSIGKRVELAALLNIRISDLIPGMPVDEITEAISQIVRSMPPHRRASLLAVIEAVAAATDDPPPDNPGPRKARVKQHS